MSENLATSEYRRVGALDKADTAKSSLDESTASPLTPMGQTCDQAGAKLVALARRFDAVLCLSPTNTHCAMRDWLSAGGQSAPDLEYRKLDFNPSALRHELHAIDLDHLDEPLIEGLLIEKRHELDLQLVLLEQRGTAQFKLTSEQLYGSVSDDLHSTAQDILKRETSGACPHETLDADQLRTHARTLIAKYQRIDARFDPHVEIREDVVGMLVNFPDMLVDHSQMVSSQRVDPLLSHELSVHMLTAFNGNCQKLGIFSIGLAGYEGIQEGLGVFAEWAVGGLDNARLRLIAGRVIAVRAMLDGAEFSECHRLLVGECGLDRQLAFKLAVRVYRSGGLAKDAIYLRGFLKAMELIALDCDLTPYWLGKIASVHVPIVNLLLERGWLIPPRLTPEFLDRPDVKERIANYRADPSPSHWLP